MSEDREIPKGWAETTLGEIISISSGKGLVQAKQVSDGTYFVYGGNGIVGNHNCYLFEQKQLIIGRVGVHCGNIHITKKKSWITDNAFVVSFNLDNMDLHYLYWFIKVLNLNKYSSSTAQPVISQGKLYPIKIIIPPLSEQHRIVAKIEELFSSLDKGIESLKTAKEQLKLYRQAVLKWAFEGKPLVKFKELVLSTQNGISKRIGITGKLYKVLRLADISNSIIVNSEPRQILLTEAEFEKYKLKEKDLLCIRVNGSKELVGTIIYVNNNDELNEWAFCDHLIRFILKEDSIAKYYSYFFKTVSVRKYIHNNLVTSAGQNTVSQPTVLSVKVPFVSIEEQKLIVSEIESRLSVCDKIEESITTSLLQAEALRQSILKKAFEGKLVPQDPNDEPASVLLERIKAEREKNKLEKSAKLPIKKSKPINNKKDK